MSSGHFFHNNYGQIQQQDPRTIWRLKNNKRSAEKKVVLPRKAIRNSDLPNKLNLQIAHCSGGSSPICFTLEAQQRYFSYPAMLVAMVLQNSFVLVVFGVSCNHCEICCTIGYHADVPVRAKCQGGGYRTILGEC